MTQYVTQDEFERAKRNFKQTEEAFAVHKNIDIPCAICGERSTDFIYSLTGGLKWYMCDNHKGAGSFFGSGSMGVVIDGVETKMAFLDAQYEALRKLNL